MYRPIASGVPNVCGSGLIIGDHYQALIPDNNTFSNHSWLFLRHALSCFLCCSRTKKLFALRKFLAIEFHFLKGEQLALIKNGIFGLMHDIFTIYKNEKPFVSFSQV